MSSKPNTSIGGSSLILGSNFGQDDFNIIGTNGRSIKINGVVPSECVCVCVCVVCACVCACVRVVQRVCCTACECNVCRCVWCMCVCLCVSATCVGVCVGVANFKKVNKLTRVFGGNSLLFY